MHRPEDEHAGAHLQVLGERRLGLADRLGERRRVEAGLGVQLGEAGEDRRRAVHRIAVDEQPGNRAAPLAIDLFDPLGLLAGDQFHRLVLITEPVERGAHREAGMREGHDVEDELLRFARASTGTLPVPDAPTTAVRAVVGPP